MTGGLSYPGQPLSQKSNRFLPAPLTQGSLCVVPYQRAVIPRRDTRPRVSADPVSLCRGRCVAQRIEMNMIAGGNHTITNRRPRRPAPTSAPPTGRRGRRPLQQIRNTPYSIVGERFTAPKHLPKTSPVFGRGKPLPYGIISRISYLISRIYRWGYGHPEPPRRAA